MKILNKFTSIIAIMMLLTTFTISNADASTISRKFYEYKNINISGNFSEDLTKNSYKKIITSYSQLNKLKKYVKKNYCNPKKYLCVLNKYNKKFFKRNALIFTTENVDMNSKEYIFSSLERNNKIIVNIGINYTLQEGKYTTTVIRYSANTYFINIKKSKLKNIKKVKIKYFYIEEEKDS